MLCSAGLVVVQTWIFSGHRCVYQFAIAGGLRSSEQLVEFPGVGPERVPRLGCGFAA